MTDSEQQNLGELENDYKSNYNQKSIIVIGAGPCGLLSTKYLKEEFNVICIEGRHDIGGMWLFEQTNESNHPNLEENSYYLQNGCLFSSLYENIKSNVPKSFMTYKGFPPKEDYDEFMSQEQFYEYIQDYSTHHNIKERIVFNTHVFSIYLTKNMTKEDLINKTETAYAKKFLVELRSTDDYTKNIRFLQADYVIVATGHFSVPNYPQIPNALLFKGLILHSHYFRYDTINQFSNKHLVVYGCNMSSQDIVYIFLRQIPEHKRPAKITMIGNENSIKVLMRSTAYQEEYNSGRLILKYPYIKEFDGERSMVLESGEKIEDVDCILYGTGYKHSYPFLENSGDNLIQVLNKDQRHNCFGPLYKKMFCVTEPNLIFLGVAKNTLSIQLYFERQAICVLKYIQEKFQLPPEEEMLAEFKEELQRSELISSDQKEFFRLSNLKDPNEILYMKSLAELISIPIDEDCQQKFLEIIFPVYSKIHENGDYANWRNEVFTDKIPHQYTSNRDLF